MANWPSFTFAPRLRGGCLPFGEARGGVFARSELPHPCHVLLSLCKGNTFSFICKTQLYPKWKTPPASWCHSSSSSCCFRSCKCGLQGSGIHFLSSQIFSRSSRKRFDKMSFGATKKHRHVGGAFLFYAPRPSRAAQPAHHQCFTARSLSFSGHRSKLIALIDSKLRCRVRVE